MSKLNGLGVWISSKLPYAPGVSSPCASGAKPGAGEQRAEIPPKGPDEISESDESDDEGGESDDAEDLLYHAQVTSFRCQSRERA